MKMYQYLLFFLLTCHATMLVSKLTNKIRMITDIIMDTEKVTSVVAHVCWKPFDRVQMMSRLGNAETKKTIAFVDKSWANIVEPQKKEHLIIVADINCPTAEDFIKMANATKKFGLPYRWLVVGKAINETAVTTSFTGMHLLPDADVIIAQKNDTNSFFLHMIYKVKIKSKWLVEHYGIWTAMKGLKKFEVAKSSISTRRKNLHRETIKSALVILDNRTKTNLYDLSDVFTDTVTKSTFRQTDPLYSYINASRTFAYSTTYGYFRNGTFDGIVAELSEGDSDLAGSVLLTNPDRMKVLDYLNSPIPIAINFVFREPPLSYQNNLYLLPFKTNVWYCIGAFVLLTGFILYVTTLWENMRLEENATDPTVLKSKASDVTILVISAVAQQGSNMELKGTLGRIVMFILFLAFLLLYSAYSASIVALLQSSSNQIKTLSDLLNSKLEVGVDDTPYNRYFFPSATEPVRKALYQYKIAPRGTKPKFMTMEEGVKKLQKEPFAFNMEVGIGYRLIERHFHEHEKCGLQEITYYYSSQTYITCRKNSPYREIFKIGLLRNQEHGLAVRENRLIYTRKPSCWGGGGSFDSVNMVDFHPVLLMYIYGALLAFALLAVEILVHRKMNGLACCLTNRAVRGVIADQI